MEKKKNPVAGIFLSLLPMLAALGCQIVGGFVGEIVYGIKIGMEAALNGNYDVASILNNLLSDSGFVGTVTLVSELMMLLCGALWYFLAFRKKDKGIKTLKPMNILFVVLLGLSLQVVITLILNLIFTILPEAVYESYQDLSDMLLDTSSWMFTISVAVIGPIAEELFFRGITIKIADKYMPTIAAVFVQAFWFGCMHFGNGLTLGALVQVIYAFLLGVLFGLIAAKFGSVWPTIILHIVVNSSSELLTQLAEKASNPDMVSYLMIPVGLLCLGGAVLVYIGISKKMKLKEQN